MIEERTGQLKFSTTACLGKEALTPARAREIATKMRKRRRVRVASAHAYRCRVCGAWHVGATPKEWIR